LIVGELDIVPGLPVSFVIGQTVLERFYCILDSESEEVGFAVTSFTNATTN
jgi:hypothetical protein